MGSCEGESASSVLLGAINRRTEAFDAVADGAGTAARGGAQLTGVRIAMTGLAALEGGNAQRVAGAVAVGAGDPDVASAQRVARAVVIETGVRRRPEGRGRVAGGTRRPQPALMGIGVAVGARRQRPLGELRKEQNPWSVRGRFPLAMAIGAGDAGVGAVEGIAGRGVVEAGSFLPGLFAVAAGAGCGLVGAAMRIGVARRAGGGEAQMGPSQIELGLDLEQGPVGAVDAMTLLAVEPGMASPQLPTGPGMVEAGSPTFEMDEVELAAVVLGVAPLAGAVVGACVQAGARGDASAERAVTVETERGVDSLAGAVAREAVLAPLERGVRRRERTGRDLRAGARGRRRQRERKGRELSRRGRLHPPPMA